MKKFFALVLAVAMIMSMSAVSFAALEVDPTPRDYDNDAKSMKAFFTDVDSNGYPYIIEYGDTVYFALSDSSAIDVINGHAYYKFFEKVKVKTTIELGEDLVESVGMVKKAVKDQAGVLGSQYFIAVKLAAKNTVAEADVVGEFEIDRKEVKLDGRVRSSKCEDLKVPFAFPVVCERNWNAFDNYFLVNGDEVELKYDKAYTLKFDSDDEVEFVFGGKERAEGSTSNEGVFTVDVSGQGKLFIKWNTKADEAIAAANEGAEMYFVNFGGVKFNRAGEFVYELEDVAAAYQVVDGALVAIPGVEIEDDEVSFRTNVLGNYVFATSELA